jgi:hypothetical protein
VLLAAMTRLAAPPGCQGALPALVPAQIVLTSLSYAHLDTL